MGLGACGVGPSGVIGVGALYINKHRRITLGKKNFAQITPEKEFSPNLFLESLCDLVSQYDTIRQ